MYLVSVIVRLIFRDNEIPSSFQEKLSLVCSSVNRSKQLGKAYGELIHFQGRSLCKNCFASLLKRGLL